MADGDDNTMDVIFEPLNERPVSIVEPEEAQPKDRVYISLIVKFTK